MLIGPKSISAE